MSNKKLDLTEKGIGETVFSIEFGIGLIVEIGKIQAGGDDFLIVESGEDKARSYFPIAGKQKFRFVSEKNDFEMAVEVLKSKKKSMNFDSKKERINFFKESAKKYELVEIVSLLSQMNLTEDLGPMEKKLMDKFIETISEEVSILENKTVEDSREYIEKILEEARS